MPFKEGDELLFQVFGGRAFSEQKIAVEIVGPPVVQHIVHVIPEARVSQGREGKEEVKAKVGVARDILSDGGDFGIDVSDSERFSQRVRIAEVFFSRVLGDHHRVWLFERLLSASPDEGKSEDIKDRRVGEEDVLLKKGLIFRGYLPLFLPAGVKNPDCAFNLRKFLICIRK